MPERRLLLRRRLLLKVVLGRRWPHMNHTMLLTDVDSFSTLVLCAAALNTARVDDLLVLLTLAPLALLLFHALLSAGGGGGS